MIGRLAAVLGLWAAPVAAQKLASEPGSAPDSTAPQAAFRFSRQSGAELQAMWRESSKVHAERVGCLAATVRADTVFVTRVLQLPADQADSMSIGSETSVERCGPPEWSGTVHTHVAVYADDKPSARFSAQDRGVMRRWYERWHADGVFCLVYSARDAHCEADGVVGGMRSQPRAVQSP